MASLLKNSLVHWKKKLERTSDETAILTTIHKLSKVPITVDLLQDTGIGKVIRSLAKKPGKVGSKASSVLQNWRDVVASSQKTSSSAEDDSKHHSHKRETFNGEEEKHHKQSSSSHERHKKSKHSSVSSHKQKHVDSNSEYANNSRSTVTDKPATNLVQRDCIKKEYESTFDFNSGKYVNEDSDASEKSFDSKESKRKEYDKHKHTKNLIHPDSIKKERESAFEFSSRKHLNGDSDESAKSFDSKESKRKVPESQPLKNGLIDVKKHKNEFAKTFDRDRREKNIEQFSPVENGDRKRKYEKPLTPNGTPDKKKHKHENSPSSVSYSSPVTNELKDGDKHKKRDKDKKSSKHNDHKVAVKSESCEKEPLSSAKKDKESKKKSSSKPKSGIKIEPTEAFTSSEVRFEDCLGFNDIVPVKKKKTSKSTSEKKEKPIPPKKDVSNGTEIHKKHTSSSGSKHHKVKTESPDYPDLLLEPAPTLNEVDILSTLPQTQPTYRPLPQRNYDCIIPKKKDLSNEEAIKFTSSRREKTSVYSGRKNVFYTEVPTLLDSCIRVLIENIDAIEYMGGIVPYYILKQVLVRCSAQQLHNIEDYNPYLLEDTQELWEIHCKKDFRNHKPQENETWRDLYWRAFEEREKKLRSITANISASMTTKYKPGRQVKMAYVDSIVKPPREVARKQAKHGTALPVNHPMKAGPPSKATPRPTAPVINSAASQPSHSREFVPKKPKVAPLMAKTLKSMKQCFRR